MFSVRSKMLEDERYLDEKERIRQRSSDRRAERKAKSDEIKKKYGEESYCIHCSHYIVCFLYVEYDCFALHVHCMCVYIYECVCMCM